MSYEFKPGDRVICIDPGSYVKKGQEYTVKEFRKGGHGGKSENGILLEGMGCSFNVERFELVETAPEKPQRPKYRPDHIKSKWGFQVISNPEMDWDDEGEDRYLTITSTRNTHDAVSKALEKHLADDVPETFQEFCTTIGRSLRNTSLCISSMSPDTKAYVLHRLIDHFLPDMTDHRLNARILLDRDVELEPELRQYAADWWLAIHKSPSTITPTAMSTISKYYETPIANLTLVYGNDIKDMDDEGLIKASEEIQDRIDRLRKIPGNSRKVARQIKEAEAAQKLVTEQLDKDEPTAQ